MDMMLLLVRNHKYHGGKLNGGRSRTKSTRTILVTLATFLSPLVLCPDCSLLLCSRKQQAQISTTTKTRRQAKYTRKELRQRGSGVTDKKRERKEQAHDEEEERKRERGEREMQEIDR